MKAYVFPGQGAQFTGMGKDLYENSPLAAALFEKANEILGFRITDIMFEGTAEELKETKVTQPAVFLHSVILAKVLDVKPDMVAGHSLGEFSALVVNGALSFEDGLKLVSQRAMAMQKAVVASNIGWAMEIIEDGVDGFLVNPKLHQEYADKIIALLDNQTLRKEFGKNARMKINDIFSIEVVAKQSKLFYKSVSKEIK